MDAGVTGAVIGLGVMACVGVGICLQDKYTHYRNSTMNTKLVTAHETQTLLRKQHTSMRSLFTQIRPPLSQASAKPIQILETTRVAFAPQFP